MLRTATAVSATLGLALAANASFYASTGPVPVGTEDDNEERITIDISDLTGEFTGFILTANIDSGVVGNPNLSDTEFDFDIRAFSRTSTDVPFFQFLDDNNFDFQYDDNGTLTVADDFMSTLVGGTYNSLRLTFFNDTNRDIVVEDWTLQLVPAPGAIGLLAGAGLFAARRRRA